VKIGDLAEGDVVIAGVDGLDLEALVIRVGDQKWPGLRDAANVEFPAHPKIGSKWIPIAELKETS